MMWLSTIVLSRYWVSLLEIVRAWVRTCASIVDDSAVPALPVPGQYGRTFGRRPGQNVASYHHAADSSATSRPRTLALDCDNVMRIGRYRSLLQLREMLVAIDHDCSLKHPTVLLILAANFSGHLPGLIHRTTWGRRLVLVAETGCVPLPGKMTITNLAARETALGWGQIIFERDLVEAFNGTLQSLERHEPLVVLWPEWLTDSLPLDIVYRQHCVAINSQAGVSR